jgi:protein-disulfide isomerase
MNTKHIRRIVFWACFLAVLALIVWGLAVSMNKQLPTGDSLSLPKGPLAPVSTSDHIYGRIDAPVTLVEYSDFQCPACENYYWFVSTLTQDASTTMRFVYRNFPLPQHANAIPASLAAESAGLQGKYWEMFDLLFRNHNDWTELSDPSPIFMSYAKNLGLNITKFSDDLKNPALTAHIQADLASGQAVGINSTPTFFINGKAVPNPQSYAEFKKLIDEAAKASTR